MKDTELKKITETFLKINNAVKTKGKNKVN
jgi:hypothetical protein